MKTLMLPTVLMALVMAAVPASNVQGQEPPAFMKKTFPEQGVEAAWQEFQAVMGPGTALEPKTKELIALAVAAQIPCDYCVHYHTAAAKAQGASQAEIKDALASSALVRQWSTMLNGSEYDDETWRQEVDAMFAGQ